jgi:hypothetical protein
MAQQAEMEVIEREARAQSYQERRKASFRLPRMPGLLSEWRQSRFRSSKNENQSSNAQRNSTAFRTGDAASFTMSDEENGESLKGLENLDQWLGKFEERKWHQTSVAR